MAIRSAFAVRVASTLAQPCGAAKKPITIQAPMNARPSLAGHADAATMGKLSVYTLSSGQQTELVNLKKLEEAATWQTTLPVFDGNNRNVSEGTAQPFNDGKHTTAFFEERLK